MTVTTEQARERNRRASRAAKRRRTGVCESCGAVTRYSGTNGVAVSRRCRRCAAVENGVSQRGHGPVMDKVMDMLANGDRTRSQIRDQLGLTSDRMGLLLGRLVRAGRIARVRRGVYRRVA